MKYSLSLLLLSVSLCACGPLDSDELGSDDIVVPASQTTTVASPSDRSERDLNAEDPGLLEQEESSRTDVSALPADSEPAGRDSDGPRFVEDAADGASVIAVVPERYVGVWYEIATTPSFQQASCSGTTAEYSAREDGAIRVVNRCYIGGFDGRLNEIEGTATPRDDTYARLTVDFGFGFQGAYTVVDLDGSDGSDPYQFAVVSGGNLLWILSRSPIMDESLYALLVSRTLERGLPADQLEKTLHQQTGPSDSTLID